jgi:hypothetical protein
MHGKDKNYKQWKQSNNPMWEGVAELAYDLDGMDDICTVEWDVHANPGQDEAETLDGGSLQDPGQEETETEDLVEVEFIE